MMTIMAEITGTGAAVGAAAVAGGSAVIVALLKVARRNGVKPGEGAKCASHEEAITTLKEGQKEIFADLKEILKRLPKAH